MENSKVYRRTYRRLFRKSRKRIIRYGLLSANVFVLAIVVVFVVKHPALSQAPAQNSLGTKGSDSISANPLDQLSSADIAVHIAHMTNLPESAAVTEHADTVNAQLSITAADEKVVAKPQVVNTSTKSVKDIQTYTTVGGDTVPGVAAKLGVSSDSLRWSNSLTGDTLAPGKQLIAPPSGINGIVYTVKAGDTADTLAEKYRTNKDQVIVFNDAEIGGLRLGTRIVIPDGILPSQRATAAIGGYTTASFAWGGFSAVYSGNGYDYGYCTWWVAYRRAQVGKPIPSNLGNASTWKSLAQRSGLPVSNTPQTYAVIWFPPTNYYGHVGFVEGVNADGSVEISEMNANAGWGRVDNRTIPASEAGRYSYIN